MLWPAFRCFPSRGGERRRYCLNVHAAGRMCAQTCGGVTTEKMLKLPLAVWHLLPFRQTLSLKRSGCSLLRICTRHVSANGGHAFGILRRAFRAEGPRLFLPAGRKAWALLRFRKLLERAGHEGCRAPGKAVCWWACRHLCQGSRPLALQEKLSAPGNRGKKPEEAQGFEKDGRGKGTVPCPGRYTRKSCRRTADSPF